MPAPLEIEYAVRPGRVPVCCDVPNRDLRLRSFTFGLRGSGI